MLRAEEHTAFHAKWSTLKTYRQENDTNWAVSTYVFRYVTFSEKRGHAFENDLSIKKSPVIYLS